MSDDWRSGGFGLYIHWPFCEAKCPYCDFNSHVRQEIDQFRWLRAYIHEIDRYAAETPGRVLNSVFFGGGTPSLMDPEIVSELIAHVRRTWPMANDIEISLEANPSSVEAMRFAGFSQAGVNRISMGIQALNDRDLKKLGRLHSLREAYQALDIARENFSRVSFDLIYARQDQTLEDWMAELEQALELAVDHLSLYQLTIEPGTAFNARHKAGKLDGLPDDALGADMFHATQELCEAAGFTAYEVSNHAKPGAESRHNLIYWRYGDYIGIGPGAHGRISLENQKFGTETWLNPEQWINQVETGSGEKSRIELAPRDQAIEFLMMGLRLTEGVETERFSRISGSDLERSALDYLNKINMLKEDEQRIFVTPQGRAVLNSVIAELLPD